MTYPYSALSIKLPTAPESRKNCPNNFCLYIAGVFWAHQISQSETKIDTPKRKYFPINPPSDKILKAAAFSILSDGGLIGKYFLLGVSILVSLWLIWWAQKTPAMYKQKLFGQFFLLSGAVGNLIDRALYGYVIDFIDLHVNSFYWPVFNLADSFIFIGVALIIFERKSSTQ